MAEAIGPGLMTPTKSAPITTTNRATTTETEALHRVLKFLKILYKES